MSAKPRPKLADLPDEDKPQEVSQLWESLASVKSTKHDWLLPGRLAFGTFALLEGQKSAGKSTLCAAIAAYLTAGGKLPGAKKRRPSDVLWLTSEENYRTDVRPRLQASGCDLKRVHYPKRDDKGFIPRLAFPSSSQAIQDAITHFGCSLVVLDPLASHLDAGVDLSQEQSVRPVLEGICRLAQVTSCLILAIRHLKKDKSCGRLDQGLGSVAIANVARSVLAIDQPDIRFPRRVLRVVATNQTGRVGPLEYSIVASGTGAICTGWKELPLADDDPEADQMDQGERDARNDAAQLLRRVLKDTWIEAKAVLAEAEATGIGSRTLRSVKASLGVRSRRVGTSTPAHWEWGPPKGGWI